MNQGLYIVIEGPDGTGKTTQAQQLAKELQKRGKTTRYVHEPGETPMGLELEKIIKNRELSRTPATDLLLFTANRLEVFSQVIEPALQNGEIIIADRSWISSAAYQGVASGLGIETVVKETEKWLPKTYVQPSATVLLDVADQQHQAMLSGRGTSTGDYFESKPDTFQQMLANGYQQIAAFLEANGQPFVQVSATSTIEQVQQRLLQALENIHII